MTRNPDRTGLNRLARIALLAAALTGFGATAAAAHAHLTASDPADGAELATAPDSATLTFSEAVTVTAIHITDARGQAVEASRNGGMAPAKQTRLSLPLLAPGLYGLAWRAQSADGHPMSGTLSFTIR